jgi:F-box/leucine-rich repeat protein 10/11
VATQSSSQWALKQWAEYVRTGVDPTGNSSKVYNIISLEVTGTELAKKVRAPRLVREIDWVDNFWNFPGGKGVVVDEKNHETNGINEHEGHLQPNGLPGSSTNGVPKVNGSKEQDHSSQPNGITETKPKGKAPSSWPKVQLYCLVSRVRRVWLTTDGHEGFVDRLARRLCRKLGLLYDTYRFQGILLYQAHRKELESV